MMDEHARRLDAHMKIRLATWIAIAYVLGFLTAVVLTAAAWNG